MTSKFLISFAVASLFLTSCKTDIKVKIEHDSSYNELKKAEWFLGEWSNKTPEGELTERWKKENDSVYKGESYFVKHGKDTVFSEKVDLIETNGKLTYIVTVPGQNSEQPVAFEMISASENQVVFENPNHDYPSKIIYNKISSDSIVAEISGMQKGKPAHETFPLKKQ